MCTPGSLEHSGCCREIKGEINKSHRSCVYMYNTAWFTAHMLTHTRSNKQASTSRVRPLSSEKRVPDGTVGGGQRGWSGWSPLGGLTWDHPCAQTFTLSRKTSHYDRGRGRSVLKWSTAASSGVCKSGFISEEAFMFMFMWHSLSSSSKWLEVDKQ